MNRLEFLAMSLPFGLKILRPDTKIIQILFGLDKYSLHFYEQGDVTFGSASNINNKPLLHPLSDLTKEIGHNGERFVPKDKLDLSKYINEALIDIPEFIQKIPFYIVQKLIEWHFDIAGLIEKGEAIDINTVPKNPYK